jgi:hypothetical protein
VLPELMQTGPKKKKKKKKNPFKAKDLLYVPQALTSRNSVFSPQCSCVLCVDSEQTAIIYLYSINLFLFIKEGESVYCAVRTGL